MLGPDKQTNDSMDQAFMTEGVGISAEQFQELRDQPRRTQRCSMHRRLRQLSQR
jgi:hypothetical protein